MLQSAELRGDVELLARALLMRSSALVSVGRRREGVWLTRAVADIAAENGLTDMVLRAKGNLSNYVSELDLGAALETNRETLALARRAGHRDQLLNTSGNIGYTAYLAGEWDEAMATMEAVWSDDLAPRDAALLLNNMLDIRAGRGEPTADGLAQLELLGAAMTDQMWQIFLEDVRANQALAAGDLRGASESFVKAAESDPNVAADAYTRAVRPALWARDLTEARRLTALAEAVGGYGPLIAARRATLHAGIAALDGRSAEALGLYREALRGWRSTHAVWDEALTGIDMATLLDPSEPEVAAVIVSTARDPRTAARQAVSRAPRRRRAAAGRAPESTVTVTVEPSTAAVGTPAS